MNIKAIYINEQRVIFGSDQLIPTEPDWAAMEKSDASPMYFQTVESEYEQAITLWKSQAIRFENQEEIRKLLINFLWSDENKDEVAIIKDWIYPLSNPIECEVNQIHNGKYGARLPITQIDPPLVPIYENVLSIKSSSEEKL